MKKNLLFAFLALTTTSFAQFTNMNTPADGDGAYMYVLDTNASNMASVVGTGVTWDYSSTSGIQGETKTVAVTAASASTYASDYTTASVAIDIPGFITAFNKSTASNYVSKGFVFVEPSFGTVKARFNVDDEALMTYTANVGDSWTDVISGDVVTTSYGTLPCTGTAATMVDGSGTLKLNAATTLNNVSRFRIQDSLHVTVMGFGEVIMKRTQYEYYDLANSHLPVFVHTSISVSLFGGENTTGLVLSSVAPDTYLAVGSEELKNVSVYPNPANDVLNIGGLTEDATVQIFSLSGQLVKTVELSAGTTAIAIQDLNSGSYLVKATTAKGTLTTKVTVQ